MIQRIFTIMFMCSVIYTFAIGQAHYISTDREKFINTHQCEGCDLSGLMLENNLTEHKNYSNSKLHGAILDSLYIDYYGDECNFNNSDFSNSSMIKSNFMHVSAALSNFNNANLQYARVGGNFSGASFNNANLSYSELSRSIFIGCDFSNANFSHANLAGADFYNAKVTIEQLSSADSLYETILPDGSVCRSYNDKQSCLKNKV